MPLEPNTEEAVRRAGYDPERVAQWLARYSCFRVRHALVQHLGLWARDYLLGRGPAEPPIPEYLHR